MSGLLLSYIIPVHNTERYLSRCIQSVLKQGLADDEYEVLVVDDGSTDGSRDLAASFSVKYQQVHLIIQPNNGVSLARNRALEDARGRYVQFVDSDDYLEEGMMAGLLKRAVDEDLDVLQFNYRNVAVDGVVTTNQDGPSTSVMTGVDFLKGHRLTPYVWRFLVKRAYLEEHGWRFNPSLIVCEDGALISQFMLEARRMAYSADAPYCYVNRSDSAMHNPDKSHLLRRIFSQIDSASSINDTIRDYELKHDGNSPASVAGLRNVYLYFAMTKALTTGCVDEAVDRMRQAGLYPFPCVGPEANYHGMKWKVIYCLMMHPRLWAFLSKVYQAVKKS